MRQSLYYSMVAPFYDTLVPRDIEGVCDSVEVIVKKYNQKRDFWTRL